MTEAALINRLDAADIFPAYGRVNHVAATHVEADGPLSALGALCRIEGWGGGEIVAEVTGVSAERVTLVPLHSGTALRPGDRVVALRDNGRILVGDGFAGRAVDALGRPIDSAGPIAMEGVTETFAPLTAILDRVSPSQSLATGVRAIDGLLPIGIGQRIGIFAASGVGKTRLMEQLAHQVDCDHVIICQVGERGREVESLWADLQNSVRATTATLVAATSDESAPMRVRAVEQALALAVNWRAKGRHVLLFIDSVTRLAMALREIGLASGEPPTIRAYTPNVLRALPQIVERCGAIRSGGAITAVFTVLAETDDVDDPIVEVMKSLLDGHIVLSRRLAQIGHYPAIDVGRSISRLASRVATLEHHQAAGRALAMLGTYEEARVLVESGLYAAGSDGAIDVAISARPHLRDFLQQSSDLCSTWDETLVCLSRLTSEGAIYG